MTHDEIIAVVTAHKNGKAVECRQYLGEWKVIPNPSWNFATGIYRVKPEPMVRYITVYGDNNTVGIHKTLERAQFWANKNGGRVVKMVEEL